MPSRLGRRDSGVEMRETRRSSTTVENVQHTPTGRIASRSDGTGDRPRTGKRDQPLPASFGYRSLDRRPRLCFRVEGRDMLAAVGGIGIVGILVVALVVVAIVYFVRRS